MFRRPLLGLLLIGTLALAPASSAAAQPSWSLVDTHQSTCYYPPYGWTNYYAAFVQGSWSKPISVSVAGAPVGSTSWTYESPIEPGSSDGSTSLAYIALHLPSSTPIGTYSAVLTASDGSSTQTVPVTVTVRSSCSHY